MQGTQILDNVTTKKTISKGSSFHFYVFRGFLTLSNIVRILNFFFSVYAWAETYVCKVVYMCEKNVLNKSWNSLMNLVLISKYGEAKTLLKARTHLNLQWPTGGGSDFRSPTLKFHLTISTLVTIKSVKISDQSRIQFPQAVGINHALSTNSRKTDKADIMSMPVFLWPLVNRHIYTATLWVILSTWFDLRSTPTGNFLILHLREVIVEIIIWNIVTTRTYQC